ncbi:MAG: MotA/TolQ/ExbB proton channel family protein, partial [Verrucomicrobiae bacterium]|nr:MotA/TolQ/ExbB proton channel family protein [Verrucomicrobiae bacterium]
GIKGPVGVMLVSALEHIDADEDLIEEILYERMLSTQPKLERYLPFISVTAATAPLLGLLGTVTGMINTFKLITIFGTGDATRLSSGISEALITTEYGLIIAIPTLIAHALLSRMSKAVLGSMERTAVGFVNGLPHKQ